MELDDLSFLLTNPPAAPKGDDGLDLPFAPGSFARECIVGWIREADRIDAGELKLPGKLGEILARANRESVREALEKPTRFALLAEQAGRAYQAQQRARA